MDDWEDVYLGIEPQQPLLSWPEIQEYWRNWRRENGYGSQEDYAHRDSLLGNAGGAGDHGC